MLPISFSPAHSLGWRGNNPLDGLNCYLRCLEAILLSRGLTAIEVAKGLTTPIDLTGDAPSKSNIYPACIVEWRGTKNRQNNWIDIRTLLKNNSPVILRPDRYYWPGTPHYYIRHWADHMLLLIGLHDNKLIILNTEGRPDQEYREEKIIDDDFINSCVRYASIELQDTQWLIGWEKYQLFLIEQSCRNLKNDIKLLEEFGDYWGQSGLSSELAKSLHTTLLGDFQPTFFLFHYLANIGMLSPLKNSEMLLALLKSRSLMLAFSLLGENEKLSDGDYPVSLYAFEKLLGLLKDLASDLQDFRPSQMDNSSQFVPPDHSFIKRLLSLSSLFSCPIEK